MFGTFNGFWGYHNTELNVPTLCCMSKIRRHVREKDNKQETRTAESCLAVHRAALLMGSSSSSLKKGLAEAGLKKCTDALIELVFCTVVVMLIG